MKDPVVICSKCGKRITEGQVFTFGDLKDDWLQPIFCSTTCAEQHDPTNLTVNGWASLEARLCGIK